MRERDGGREEERRYRKRESVDESRSEVRFRLRKIVVRGFSCASVLSTFLVLSSFFAFLAPPFSSFLPTSSYRFLSLLNFSLVASLSFPPSLLPPHFSNYCTQVIANSKNFFYIRITNSTINTYKYSLQFSFYSY